ncbi:hypothetical protein SKAU_G00088260 [Synaphobranchus kaupii]|uniref:Uncharacterized protein n=1 Tax=Synaphobranchus kaupii TaxID=118154 RepID=A0A9Q1FW05_SYNKA|nr:hypothetical protein SKAU_G00088260 [Synaphobranchus kaupii]
MLPERSFPANAFHCSSVLSSADDETEVRKKTAVTSGIASAVRQSQEPTGTVLIPAGAKRSLNAAASVRIDCLPALFTRYCNVLFVEARVSLWPCV